MASKLKCPYTEEELKDIRNNFKGDKLICPFCHQELHKDPDGYCSCYTDNCSVMSAGGNGAGGTESLWTALIQAKQDLKNARKALEELIAYYDHYDSFDGEISWDGVALIMRNDAHQALETIGKHKVDDNE